MKNGEKWWKMVKNGGKNENKRERLERRIEQQSGQWQSSFYRSWFAPSILALIVIRSVLFYCAAKSGPFNRIPLATAPELLCFTSSLAFNSIQIKWLIMNGFIQIGTMALDLLWNRSETALPFPNIQLG